MTREEWNELKRGAATLERDFMLRFSADQRTGLVRIGVNEDQIAELERVLPLARALLSKPARFKDVRDELQSLDKAILETRNRLRRCSRTDADQNVLRDIQARLIEADEKDVMPQTGPFLRKVNAVVRLAIHKLPRDQSRHRTASPLPISLIWRALVTGYARRHTFPAEPVELQNPERRHQLVVDNSDKTRWKTLSRFSGSAFREVVGTCYDAMGQENIDPERAIRAFIHLRSASVNEQRNKISRKTARRIGRQVGKKK